MVCDGLQIEAPPPPEAPEAAPAPGVTPAAKRPRGAPLSDLAGAVARARAWLTILAPREGDTAEVRKLLDDEDFFAVQCQAFALSDVAMGLCEDGAVVLWARKPLTVRRVRAEKRGGGA